MAGKGCDNLLSFSMFQPHAELFRTSIDCGFLRHIAALLILMVWSKLALVVASHPALPCDRYVQMLARVIHRFTKRLCDDVSYSYSKPVLFFGKYGWEMGVGGLVRKKVLKKATCLKVSLELSFRYCAHLCQLWPSSPCSLEDFRWHST